jgi:hypothetical protein
MPKPRGATSYRFSEEAQALLAQLSGRLGLSKTGVLELAIRKLARSELAQRRRYKQPLNVPAAQP